jgi:hypothetical protein
VTPPESAKAEKVAGRDRSGGCLDPGRAVRAPSGRPACASESPAWVGLAGGPFAAAASRLHDQVSLILVEERGSTEPVTLVRFVAHSSLADRRP